MIGTPPTMPALREVDGVRALHLDGTGVTTVTLWIGAGLVDETFRSTGLAHLAEHLVMRALGRSTVMHNATTWPGMTEIWARGPAAQVAEAMARICEGIRDAGRGLDPSTVADEARILVAEGAPASTLFHPLYERYGLSGPGLLAIPPVAPQTLTADDVARWVSSYYVPSNVVVTVLGPWPDSLHLELPTGVAVPRAEAVPLPGRALPAQLSLPGYPGVALQWLRPRAEGHSAFDRIVADRLHTRLRTELGQSYSVTLETLPVDRRDVAVTIGLDCAPGAEGEVAQQSIAELLQLADEGPDPEDLEHDAATLETLLLDPEFGGAILATEAARLIEPFADPLTDHTPRDAALLPTSIRALTQRIARESYRRAVETLVVVHGADAPIAAPARLVDLPSVPDCVQGAIEGTPLGRRLFRGVRRGVRIVWNPTTLAIGSGTTWHVVAIGDVVGLGVAGSARQVVSRSGCSIDVDPRHFRGTDALVAHLDQRIDAALRFPDDRGPTPVRHG